MPRTGACSSACWSGPTFWSRNYRPGTLERLGYGWESLHARYPRLVLASVSGFGQTGPYRERPAYDLVVQAMGGIMSLTGQPGDPPVRVGTSVGDIAAGLFAAVGIQSALLDRERSGRARRVDVAMLDCQVAILENAIARFAATGSAPLPLGSRHPSITPFDAFRTATRPIVIAAGNDSLFHQLCACLGRPALADDPRYAGNDRRSQNQESLKREIEEVLATRPAEHWLGELERAGVPCGPINDLAQVLADPQVRARNMVVRAEDPQTGRLEMAGNPIKLSAGPRPRDPLSRPRAGRRPPSDPARTGNLRRPRGRPADRGSELVDFGVVLQADPPASRVVELARRAEANGFTHLWTFDSHVLAATQRLVVGPMVTNPGSRDWTLLASCFATLNDIYGPRTICGIGRGDSALLDRERSGRAHSTASGATPTDSSCSSPTLRSSTRREPRAPGRV